MSRTSDEARLETAIGEPLAARERGDAPGVDMTMFASLNGEGLVLGLPTERNGFLLPNEAAARKIHEEEASTAEMVASQVLRLAELLPSCCIHNGAEVTVAEFVAALRATGEPS